MSVHEVVYLAFFLFALLPYLTTKVWQAMGWKAPMISVGKTWREAKPMESPKDYTEPGVYLPHVQAALDFITKEWKAHLTREKFKACDHDWDAAGFEALLDALEDRMMHAHRPAVEINSFCGQYIVVDEREDIVAQTDEAYAKGPRCKRCGLYKYVRY